MKRIESLDAAKFVLVVLVVAGHMLEHLRYFSQTLGWLYRYLYLFHIPALVLASGMVARPVFDARQGRRWLAALVVPYLVFQALYLGVEATWKGVDFVYRVTTPFWLLWYLVSLACWRLLLPALLSVSHPVALSCLIALAAGMLRDVEYAFSLSRTLVFLPFFVAGHLYGGTLLGFGNRAMAVLALAALGGVAWMLRELPVHWLYAGWGYAQLKSGMLEGVALRGLLLATGLVGTWAVLKCMPVSAGWLGWLGRYSIGAYLLHGFLIRYAYHWKWFNQFSHWPAWSLVLATAAAAVLVTVLGCCVARWSQPLFDYEWLWRIRRGGEGSPAASRA